MPHRLVFFPDYRGANPYQSLLYAHSAEELYPEPGSIAEAIAVRRRQAPEEATIFHLHWEDAVYRNEPDEASARTAAERFAAELERFVDSGGTVLWTLHNEIPHDDRFPSVRAALRAVLVRLVDLVHVHGLAGVRFARDELGIGPERLAVVPHGNYRPHVAPLRGPRSSSRSALGLPEDARVLLFFGRLDAYKGGAELLEAFGRLDRPELWLVVAGKQVVPLDDGLAALPERVRGRVRVEAGQIPRERIPILFHAADALVAPYRRVLTSGAAMLALTLARPVIAPAHPGLGELVRDGVEGLLYDPAEPAGLERAIERFLALDVEVRRALEVRAEERAGLFDWRMLGNLYRGLFAMLIAARRPMRRLD
ncbi:MAG: glycosyltransferase [Geminicoccaceae bacterium]|nr:glycosyltransferase [Geminicoccaceae bacterium]